MILQDSLILLKQAYNAHPEKFIQLATKFLAIIDMQRVFYLPCD